MHSHIIHTQRIEASFQSKEAALSGQNTLQERYNKILVPLMEQIFDEYSPKGWSLRIEKLELDLGRLPADLPENMMRDRLRDILEDQLRKIHLEQGVHSFPSRDKVLPEAALPGRLAPSDWEKITYYLVYGRLPWWASSTEKEPIRSLFDQLSFSRDTLLKSWLKENPISLATAQRLSALISENQLESLLKSDLQLPSSAIQTIHVLIRLLLEKTPLNKAEITFYLNTIFLFAAFGKRNWLTAFLETGFNTLNKADNKLALSTSQFLCSLSFLILKIAEKGTISPKNVDLEHKGILGLKKNVGTLSLRPMMEQNLPSKSMFWQGVVENLRTPTNDQAELSTLSKELAHLESQEKRTAESKSPAIDELVVIHNAGLVLTAAFLPRFFENLGLVKSREFISEQAKVKGAIILQEMLGTGQEYDETDLILNKLLCGLAPASALGLLPKIETTDKKEIALLLESMATQWTALKSSSGKMIAEGFFRREGSLRKVHKGYQLQIQRLPFDMLLDRLPWTIGMIKLPWMEELISVEW